MVINKTQGTVITLCITTVLVILYFGFFDFMLKSVYAGWLTFFFFTGVLLHFMRKNPFGGELRWRGGLPGVRWESGYCLVPSIFPSLHNVDIYLLWDLDEDGLEIASDENQRVRVDHFQDQRLSNYRVDAKTSLFWLNIDKFLSWFLRWFFGIDKGSKKLFYQRFGFRIILVTLLIGFVTSYTHPRPVDKSLSKGELKTWAYLARNGELGLKEAKIHTRTKEENILLVVPGRGECVIIPRNEPVVIIRMLYKIKRLNYKLDEKITRFDKNHRDLTEITFHEFMTGVSSLEEPFSNIVDIYLRPRKPPLQEGVICF